MSDGEGADSKKATETTPPTAEEGLRHSRIEQQLDPDGAGLEGMNTPLQRRSLASDMLTEAHHMAEVTAKVVGKMNRLEEKFGQQVAVLKRQSESFKVHYLEGQKLAAQQAREASYQHQQLVEQVDKNTPGAEREDRGSPARVAGRRQGQCGKGRS